MAELRTLCVELLEEVATRENIEFRYVGMQRSRELKVREWTDVEKVV
jgi:hypothetical protein